MAKYTCPACGAGHKEPDAVCRLCGAPLDQPLAVYTQAADRSMAPNRFKAKGLGHFAVIGGVIGAVIVVGAVALGVTDKGDDEVSWIRRNVPFLAYDVDDGWIDYLQDDLVFAVRLPDDPAEVTDGFAVADNGTVTRYVATIGEDYQMTVGYTEGADLDPESFKATLDSVATTFEESLGGEIVESSGEAFNWYGYPAIDVVIDKVDTIAGNGFSSLRLVLVDDELVWVQTDSLEPDPDAHGRLENSLEISPAPPSDDQ